MRIGIVDQHINFPIIPSSLVPSLHECPYTHQRTNIQHLHEYIIVLCILYNIISCFFCCLYIAT